MIRHGQACRVPQVVFPYFDFSKSVCSRNILVWIMNILSVDTSSEHGSVAVVADGEPLGEVRLISSIQHSERLFRSIDFLFHHVDLSLDDIDLFAAARGPGSFTGLRIGLAAMEGFAFANGKPSAGISTLAALAWQTGETDGAVAPVLDARRGDVYTALFRREGEALLELQPAAVLKPAQWVSGLPEGVISFCGGGVMKYRSLFETKRHCRIVTVDPYLATSIARMAGTSNREDLAPLYIRKSDAEVGREV
jgi:tRNA threonylcarbamoyladenosine biosynthesis protein TsaB